MFFGLQTPTTTPTPAPVASTDVGFLNGANTTTGSQNGIGKPLTDTDIGIFDSAGGTTGNSGNTDNPAAAT
jgi:hypothetical protein